MGIREKIEAVFFTPLPGLSAIPGVSYITGSAKLKDLRKRAKRDLDNHKIQEELQNIEIDYGIMGAADVRDLHDREIQTTLFGKPVYDKDADTFLQASPDPLLQPILEQFIDLEVLKRNIRNNLRPPMEKQIEVLLEEIRKSGNMVSRKLEAMIKEHQRTRLTLLTERTHMLSQRQQVYSMVESYLKPSLADSRMTEEKEGTPKIDPVLARILDVQNLAENIATSKIDDADVERGIEAQYQKLAELQALGDALKQKIHKETHDQKRTIRKRATVGVLLLATTALGGLAGREMTALNRRAQPYQNIINPAFSPVPIVDDEWDQAIFKHRYHNPFGKPDIAISGHHVENPYGDINHGMAAARIFDVAARVATGEEDVEIDHGLSHMHSLASRSVSTPFLYQSYFVPARNAEVERMMTSTEQHYVLSNSVVSNASSSIGSRDESAERDLFFRTTQPYFCACGNDGREADLGGTQYSSAIMHLPRHSFQIGYASDYRSGEGRVSGINTSPGNHPFPFMLGFVPEEVPDIDRETGKMTERAADEGGSSYASPSIAGNDFALIKEYPQLTMDQYHYALAFSGNRHRMSQTAGAVREGNDMAFYEDVGFGVPDPAMAELVAQNMLYNRTLGIGMNDNPQIIYANPMQMGEARKGHTFTLPDNKGIYKVSFEIIAPESDMPAQIKITTASGYKANIRLVPGQRVNRFTWYGDMGLTGGNYHITADQDVRIGMVAHVNEPDAITGGIRNRDQLLSTEEIKQRMDVDKLEQLGNVQLITPAVVDYRTMQLSSAKISTADRSLPGR
jgi:hypothetical protein